MTNPQNEMCRMEFDRVREEIRELNKDNKDAHTMKGSEQRDIYSKLTSIEESTKSAHHRIDSMEKHTEAVIKLSVSVDNVAKQVTEIVQLYEAHNERIITLENKPAQTIYGYFQIGLASLITGIVGLALGFFITQGGGQ